MNTNGQHPQKAGREVARAVREIADRDLELGYRAVCALLSGCDADDMRKRFSAEDCETFREILRQKIDARSFRPAPASIGLSFSRRESTAPLQTVADYFRNAQDFVRIGAIDWARESRLSNAP